METAANTIIRLAIDLILRGISYVLHLTNEINKKFERGRIGVNKRESVRDALCVNSTIKKT